MNSDLLRLGALSWRQVPGNRGGISEFPGCIHQDISTPHMELDSHSPSLHAGVFGKSICTPISLDQL